MRLRIDRVLSAIRKARRVYEAGKTIVQAVRELRKARISRRLNKKQRKG